MNKCLVMPVFAAVVFAAACGGGSTEVELAPRVRFFNATTGMTGSGGFTANGQFATALGFGQATQSCVEVVPGSASFGFGAANAGGTGLNGAATMTLNNQTIKAGGDYTLVATGSAASPQLYLLDNNSSAALASNQAAVRFVNLAPGPSTLPNIFYVFTSWPPVETSALFEAGLLVGSPSKFRPIVSGTTSFTTIIGHQEETLNTNSVTLQAGSVNTIAIVPKPSGGGYQLINIPRC